MKYGVISQNTTRQTWTERKDVQGNKRELSPRGDKGNLLHNWQFCTLCFQPSHAALQQSCFIIHSLLSLLKLLISGSQ